MNINGIRKKVRLSDYTSFGIGGNADYFLHVRSKKMLKDAIIKANKEKIPFFILGGGSNVLISDNGLRGMVLKIGIRGMRLKENRIVIKAGEKLSRAVDFSIKKGLAGLEFAAGIPGTFGGAVYGNAGAYGQAVGDFLTTAELITRNGETLNVGREYFDFGYRDSRLKRTGDVLVKAELELTYGDKEISDKKVQEILNQRRQKHPTKEWGCAGSFFKNISPANPGERRLAAGYILDRIGAKGIKHGKACVFPGHANFLTNPGGATADEILHLAGLLKKKVKEEFGIELEEEVLYVDEYLLNDKKVKLSCQKTPSKDDDYGA